MIVSRGYDLLGCYHYIIHLCGFCCLVYLLALCVRAYLMHVVAYGCAISLFHVPPLRYLLESCLHVPLYVGLGVLLGFVAFEVLGAPWGAECVRRCYVGVVCAPPLLCYGGSRG